MANKFMNEIKKETQAAVQAAVEAQAKTINDLNNKIIEETTPNTIVETVSDVKSGAYYAVKNEDNDKVGVSGNCMSKVVTINGNKCYVCGYSEQELAEDEAYIRLQLQRGDVSLHKFFGFYVSGRYAMQIVTIGGQPVLTVGKTEQDRVDDEMKARICYAKMRKTSLSDVFTAEDLIEAGLNPTKEFEKYGARYMYFADQKCARDFDGVKVADISDITDTLSVDTAIELLKGRIPEPQEDEYDYDCDEDYDDYDDDDYEDETYDVLVFVK